MRSSLAKPKRYGTAYVAVVLALMYSPIIVMAAFSFNDGNLTAWKGFTLDWYRSALSDRSLLDSLKNSILLAVCSALLAAGIGTLGAVGMAKSAFRTKGFMESASSLPLMMPEIVVGMAYLAFFSLIGVKFGFLTLLIAHTTFCVPYIYINVKSRLAGLDKSIFEAGMDLGASPARVFIDITLPLIMPAVLSGALLAFAMSMDDVVISFFVSGTVNTFPIKVFSMVKVGVKPNINAVCTVMLAAVFLAVGIFRLARRIFVRRVAGE